MKVFLLVVFTAALFFCVGWLTGADDVLFDCREVGATQFFGKTFMCEEGATP